MFWVDDCRQERTARIKSFLNKEDAVVAVLLSTSNLEWTLRRAIIGLGSSATMEIRNGVLHRCSGLDGYKQAWKDEVYPRLSATLPPIISNWSELRGDYGAYNLRNRLIHGAQGTTGLEYARTRVNALLSASDDVDRFCKSHGCDIFKKLPVRRKDRSGDQT